MKNTKIIFLTLYLLSSFTAQCMKRKSSNISESSLVQLNPAKPKTIQELQTIRDSFIKKIKRNNNITGVDLILFQEYWVKNFPIHPLIIERIEFSPPYIIDY